MNKPASRLDIRVEDTPRACAVHDRMPGASPFRAKISAVEFGRIGFVHDSDGKLVCLCAMQ